MYIHNIVNIIDFKGIYKKISDGVTYQHMSEF